MDDCAYYALLGIDVAREDLAKLHRQFRVTEGSRKQYAEHATNALRKQR